MKVKRALVHVSTARLMNYFRMLMQH